MKQLISYIRKKTERLSLATQLCILATLVTTMLLSFILIRDYDNNRRTVIQRQITTSGRLLDLEMQNLEQYIKELASFCLQPVYDSEFTLLLTQKDPLDSTQETYIRSQMRTYFYSRDDLSGYQIYLMNQELAFGRTGQAQHFTRLEQSAMPQEPGFTESFEGKYYRSIMPSETDNCFFNYYQSILKIQNKQSSAVVKLEVDTTFADNLNHTHSQNGEFICILNEQGQLLFSGEPTLVGNDSEALTVLDGITSEDSRSVSLKDDKYLAVSFTGEKFGLQLVTLIPYALLDLEISYILQSSLLFGALAWLAAAILIVVIVRLATRPLTSLSASMKEVGAGNFSPIEMAGGSRELLTLSASFNEMVRHIEELINQNYLSEINEKTARLTALEAQLNPHFLYNTLQAIGTEALVNDQPQINQMVTSLAANLRYSIKGGDFVRLKDEMTHVRNYLLLQQIRLEERLHAVTITIPDSCQECTIPKISILTLVENSIIHGFGDTDKPISIEITAALTGHQLELTVSDDGCGISPEQLKQLHHDFEEYLKPGTVGKIGLANLNSRLQLLCQGQATLTIQSAAGHGTRITLRLPATTTLP